MKYNSGGHSQIPAGPSAADPQCSSSMSHLSAHKYDHVSVSPLLQELYWLSVPECIKY